MQTIEVNTKLNRNIEPRVIDPPLTHFNMATELKLRVNLTRSVLHLFLIKNPSSIFFRRKSRIMKIRKKSNGVKKNYSKFERGNFRFIFEIKNSFIPKRVLVNAQNSRLGQYDPVWQQRDETQQKFRLNSKLCENEKKLIDQISECQYNT